MGGRFCAGNRYSGPGAASVLGECLRLLPEGVKKVLLRGTQAFLPATSWTSWRESPTPSPGSSTGGRVGVPGHWWGPVRGRVPLPGRGLGQGAAAGGDPGSSQGGVLSYGLDVAPSHFFKELVLGQAV